MLETNSNVSSNNVETTDNTPVEDENTNVPTTPKKTKKVQKPIVKKAKKPEKKAVVVPAKMMITTIYHHQVLHLLQLFKNNLRLFKLYQ